MAGTRSGGLKAAATNKAKYGKGFYSRIGKKVAKTEELVDSIIIQS